MTPRPTNLHIRFWAKVDTTGGLHACWMWGAAKDRDGYGIFTMGRQKRAHVICYEMLVGPVSEGLILDHLCRNPSCVNPAHLEPVTPRENTLRGDSLQAQNARKTHCKHGHEFTTENTYVTPDGKRQCRTCCLAARRRHAIKRAASR